MASAGERREKVGNAGISRAKPLKTKGMVATGETGEGQNGAQ